MKVATYVKKPTAGLKPMKFKDAEVSIQCNKENVEETMNSSEIYVDLFKAYNAALAVCDPLEFQIRQRNLTFAVAKYLLEKDRVIS